MDIRELLRGANRTRRLRQEAYISVSASAGPLPPPVVMMISDGQMNWEGMYLPDRCEAPPAADWALPGSCLAPPAPQAELRGAGATQS